MASPAGVLGTRWYLPSLRLEKSDDPLNVLVAQRRRDVGRHAFRAVAHFPPDLRGAAVAEVRAHGRSLALEAVATGAGVAEEQGTAVLNGVSRVGKPRIG